MHPMHSAHGRSSERAREFWKILSPLEKEKKAGRNATLPSLPRAFVFFSLPVRQHNTYSRGSRAHATKQQGECRFRVQLVHAVRRVNESSEGDPREATWDWHFSGGSPSLHFGKKKQSPVREHVVRQVETPANRVSRQPRGAARASAAPSFTATEWREAGAL